MVASGTTYDVTVDPTFIDSLTINPGGIVELHGNRLFVGDNGVDTIWSGKIQGIVDVGTLFKTGSGTVTFSNLTAVNSEVHINGGKAVQGAGTTNNIRYLTIGSDGSLLGKLDITGGNLNISGPLPPFSALQVGDFGGTGIVNQTGGTLTFTTSAFNIGNQGGNGTYNLSAGSVIVKSSVDGDSGVTIGRSTAMNRHSTGVLNISGGLFEDQGGPFVIGNVAAGGVASNTQGTINQTGGTLRIGAAAQLFIGGYNKGTYNLNGGTLEIGGTSLNGAYNAAGTTVFNLGGGTIKVIGSALTTAAGLNATLTGGTSTINTNGLPATWNGTFAGGGNLRKDGVGTLTLTNAGNSYTGATIVNAGTLALGGTGAIASSSGVNLTGPTGIFDIATAGGARTIQDLSGVAGSIVNLGGNGLTAGTTNSTIFSGIIQGGGGAFTKVGGGVLTLSGMNTYTGATTISNGTIKMGATNGIMNSTSLLVDNNARWNLNGMGQQKIAGPVTFTGGVMSINLGANDNGLATGTVTAGAGGGKVDVHGGDGSFDPNVDYIFLQGSGAAGTFVVIGNDMPLLTPTAVLDGNHFELHFAKSGQTLAFLADTPNQAAVGGALDPLPLTNPLYAQIATLSPAAITEKLNELSGDFHASTQSFLLQSGLYLSGAAGDRLDTLGGAAGGVPLAYADDKGPAAPWPGLDAPKNRPVFWAQGFGHIINLGDGSGNAGLVDGRQVGILGGVDGGSDSFLAGAGGGYSTGTFDSSSRNASGDVQSAHALVYAGGEFGMVQISGGGTYSWSNIGTTRTITLPTPQTLVASYKARTAQVFGEIGADTGMFEPFAGANYINVASNAFTETGGSAALTAAANTTAVTFTTLGVRAESEMAGNATLRAMAGWRHAFGDVVPLSGLTIQGQGFTVAGVPVAKDALVAEAGIEVNVSKTMTIGASYSGQIGTDAQDHGAKGTATVKF